MDDTLLEWLYHQITIYARTDGAQDDRGNSTPSWDAGTVVLGKFEELSGSEITENRELTLGRYRVIFNAGVSITTKHRVGFGARTFEVDHVAVRYDLDGSEHHRVAYLNEVDGGPS